LGISSTPKIKDSNVYSKDARLVNYYYNFHTPFLSLTDYLCLILLTALEVSKTMVMTTRKSARKEYNYVERGNLS
jgi:hypothetical protein